MIKRCRWCNLNNPKYIEYHDKEWCKPNFNEQYLYEMLILESFQAGLSWECVLNKRDDFIKAFDNFNIEKIYKKLAFLLVDEEEKKDNNIFDIFEKEFGRTLSPMEYEIINTWLDNFKENTIVLALKEATYNGVSNLRYIDKILYEWQKKGIKTEEDIINNKKNFVSKKENKETFDYDWLNDE